MTSKLSRILIASLGFCTVVGVALAQQPYPDAPVRPATRSPYEQLDTVKSDTQRIVADTVKSDSPRIVADTMVSSRPGYYVSSTNQNLWYGNHAFPARPASAEEMNLSHQAEQAARKLSEAKSDSEREKIKGDLRDVLEQQFELRQRRHEKEIEGLEAQVKKLKDLVRKRHDNRREIISKRLDQVLSDAEGLGW
jgi:hypothetical protein